MSNWIWTLFWNVKMKTQSWMSRLSHSRLRARMHLGLVQNPLGPPQTKSQSVNLFLTLGKCSAREPISWLTPALVFSRSFSSASPNPLSTRPETGGRNPSLESLLLSPQWSSTSDPTLISDVSLMRLVMLSREVTMILPTSELGVRDSISTLVPLGLVIL